MLLPVLAAAALAAPALADTVATQTYVSVPSYKLANNAGNTTKTLNFSNTNKDAKRILITGTLHRNTNGSYPREAAIRFRRFVQLTQSTSMLTDEFIAQPFTGSTFDASGNITLNQAAVVLPVPADGNFNGDFRSCSFNQPGRWEMEFFEQYDDNAADSGATPDATWSTVTVTFDDQTPSMQTQPVVIGTYTTTTRYGFRSDGTLASPSGGVISVLPQPTFSSRIHQVRISGYLTGLSYSTTAHTLGANAAGEARLLLKRFESVQSSPGAPQPTTRTDTFVITVPPDVASSGRVNFDVMVPASDNFGNLGRILPTFANESNYYLTYSLSAFESVDDPFPTDNVWNALKVELFEAGQPPAAPVDFGTLVPSHTIAETVTTRTTTMLPGQPAWFSFTLPPGSYVTNANGAWLDIDTEGTAPLFDTMIGLYYGTNGWIPGDLKNSDDDDGSGSLSQISIGVPGPRPAIGDSLPRNGRDDALGDATYYLAVVPYVAGTGMAALGGTNYGAVNLDAAASHPVTVNLRYYLPVVCGPADVGSQGGWSGGDGMLDNNDFIVYINWFFAQFSMADLGVQGGTAGHDGLFDNNDFVVFIGFFFAGCPN